VRSVLVVRIGGPLYFANCAYVRERLLELLDAFDAHGGVRFLVVEMTPVSSLDSTALHAFRGLLQELRRRRVCLALATVGWHAERTMRAAGLLDELGDEWVHANVHSAVLHCLRHERAVAAASTQHAGEAVLGRGSRASSAAEAAAEACSDDDGGHHRSLVAAAAHEVYGMGTRLAGGMVLPRAFLRSSPGTKSTPLAASDGLDRDGLP
jgi:anti-anti-sigma factor